MNIARVELSPYTRSLDVFVAGCKGHPCKGCHNDSLWDFSVGEDYKQVLTSVRGKVDLGASLIDRIWVMGGEPLDQNHEELFHFLLELNTMGKEVWMFTRYNIGEIPPHILEALDYAKTGAYIMEMRVTGHVRYGVELASVNQKIHKLR